MLPGFIEKKKKKLTSCLRINRVQENIMKSVRKQQKLTDERESGIDESRLIVIIMIMKKKKKGVLGFLQHTCDYI